MFRLAPLTTWLILLVLQPMLVLGHGGGIVWCVESDGQVAVELAGAHDCQENSLDANQTSPDDAAVDASDCRDIPLQTTVVRRDDASSGRAVQLKLSFSRIATIHLAALLNQPLRNVANLRSYSPPPTASPAPLAQLQTVVLTV